MVNRESVVVDTATQETALGYTRQSATQISANASLVPQAKWTGIIDDAKGGDGRHQQYAADDQKDARCAGLCYLQNHERIARR